MLQQNFAYILDKKAEYYSEKIALLDVSNTKSYSYLDLSRRSKRLAYSLRMMGVEKGDRILVLTLNNVEYLDLFFATARLGAILVPVNHRLSSLEIEKIVARVEPKVFVYNETFKDKLSRIQGFAADATMVSKSIIMRPNSPVCNSFEKFIDGDDTYETINSEDSYLIILFTAGSTGVPKGVPIRYSNFYFTSVDWIVDAGITNNDVTLTVLPLFHIGGHCLFSLPHIHVGGTIILQEKFNAAETLGIIEETKVTNTFLLPSMLKMMLEVPHWEKYDISSLRFIGAGGEPVPEKIKVAFYRNGVPVVNGYGLTETTDGTTFLRPEHALAKPANCIGKTLTHVDARIVDNNGKVVGSGQKGELLHRGPCVFDSYWNDSEATKKAFRNEWFSTGDIVESDKDGFLYFWGRKDEMVVSGGENIYPAEVEDVIYLNSKVADVAVIGILDEKWGTVLKAIIVPKENEYLTENEILEFIKERLASFKKPKYIEFVDALPKGGTGKLDRPEIKKLYGEVTMSQK